MPHRALLILLLGFALGVGYYSLSRGDRVPAQSPDAPQGQARSPAPDIADQTPPTTGPDPYPQASEERRPAPRPGGVVRSSSGLVFKNQPLVARTRHTAAAHPVTAPWLASETDETLAQNGRYRFEGNLDDDPGVVLGLVTDHFVGGAMAEDSDPWPEIVLDPATPLRVEVRDTAGVPSPGARVLVRGQVDLGPAPAQHFTREYLTDPEGAVAIIPHHGTFEVRAFLDRAVSAVWRGDIDGMDGRIVLTLATTFGARGRVVDYQSEDPSELSISVRRAGNSWEEPLVTYAVDPDGTHGNTEIPWPGPGEYVLRLSGPGTCAQERTVAVEHPGGVHTVDFECRLGIGLTFQTLLDGEPEAGVRVTPYWWEPTEWVYAGGQLTDEQGLTHFDNLLPGLIGIIADKPGFVAIPYGPSDLLQSREEAIPLDLERAGMVRGRVTYQGEPVENFEVRTWAGVGLQTSERFRSRADGTFSLDNVRFGALTLHAFTEDLPPCSPEKIEVPETSEAWVDLVLTDSVPIAGKVLDAITGLPIQRARVQAYSAAPEGFTLGTWGIPAWTDAGGRFQGLQVPDDGLILSISAEGYEELLVTDSRPDPVTGELAVVALSRLQELEVRLLAADGVDLTPYKVRVDKQGTGEIVNVDATGYALLQDVKPGICQLRVFPPDGSRVDVQLTLVQGQKWTAEVPVTTGREVLVDLKFEPGAEVPEDIWVQGTFRAPTGSLYGAWASVNDQGFARFDCGSGTRASFEVMTSALVRLATHSAALEPQGSTRVVISVSAETSRVRLVNDEDQPLTDVLVVTWITGDPLNFLQFERSDSQGEIPLASFAADRMSIVVATASMTSLEHVLRLDEDGPLTVRFDTRSKLNLRLLEGDQPAPHVRVVMQTPGVPNASRLKTSDAGGGILYEGLEQGAYELRIDGNGWFPMNFEAQATPGGSPLDIAVRRRGSLEIQLTQAGLPVTGASITLVSKVPDDDVLAWAKSGLIEVQPATWTSDPQGKLRVSGLPAGEYTFSATSADGSGTVQGSATVIGAKLSEAWGAFQ
jgi:hypothetical protein